MDLEMRPVTDDEVPAYQRLIGRMFHEPPADEAIEDGREMLERDRSIAVFDRSRIVASAGAFTFDLTIPGGGTIPVAGVTDVTVAPSHRRRGILRQMMDRQLDDVAERGEPVAILTASETSIYGRFGYGLATRAVFSTVKAQGGELRRPPATDGSFSFAEPDEAWDHMPAVYDAVRRDRAGMITRKPAWWNVVRRDREWWRDDGYGPFFFALHHDPGGAVDGYALYRVKESWPDHVDDSEVKVDEIMAVDPEVETALFRFLVDLDLVQTVHLEARPTDDHLMWRLLDQRQYRTRLARDWVWARVLDVPTALSARTYGVEDALVVDIVDPFRPANEGCYRLDASAGGVACERTGAAADLTLDVRDLGALYLGGVEVSTLRRAGVVDEHTPGAVARADRMFVTEEAPWCNTMF